MYPSTMLRNVSRHLWVRFRQPVTIRSGLDRHDSFYRSRVAQTVRDPQTQVDFEFLEDELIHIEVSHKVLSIRLYHQTQTNGH